MKSKNNEPQNIGIANWMEIKEALRASEERYRDLFDNANDLIQSVAFDGHILYVNNAWRRVLGYSEDEVHNLNLLDIIHPDSKNHCMELFNKVMSGESASNIQTVFIAKNGNPISVEGSAHPRFVNGKPVATQGIFHDVTERMIAEEKLVDEATRRRILVEQSRDGIVILTQDGNVYEANQRFCEMIGYSPEETLQLKTWDWDYQLPRDRIQEMLRTVDEAGDHFETKHRRKDGSVFDVEISTNAAVFKGQKLIFCVCRDITERKQAEETLRESELFNESLLNNSPFPINVINPDTSIRYVNPSLENLTGFSSEELVGRKTPYPFWREDMAEESTRNVKSSMTQGVSGHEVQFIKKNGEIFWVRITTIPVNRVKNELDYLLVAWVDITEQKKSEEELLLRAKLLDNASDAICLLNTNGEFVYVNDMYCRSHGYSKEELMKMNIRQLDNNSTDDWVDRLRGELAKNDIVQFELTHKRKDGSTMELEIHSKIIESGGRQLTLNTERDITERNKKEQLQDGENHVLTLMGQEAELREILDAIILMGERYDSSIKGSILLFDKEQGLLLHSAGPSLPDNYIELLKQGLPPGPCAGSCGTAAFRKEQVIVTDIADSPLFQPYIEVIHGLISNGLLACWSHPIISSSGALLGTIANYSDKTGSPSVEALEVLEWSSRIAGIAIERKQAEQSLRISEERFRLIAETSPDYIIQTDKLGNILYASPACKNIVGYSPEELINHNYVDFVPASSLSIAQALLAEAQKGTIPQNVETEILHKNGKSIPVEASIASHIVNGEVMSFYSIIRDITERKQAETALIASERNYRNSFDESPTPSIIVKGMGKPIYSNQAALDLFGYNSLEEMKNINLSSHHTPENIIKIKERWDRINKGNFISEHDEHDIIRTDGTTRHVEEIITKINWDGEERVKILIHDITESKNLQEEREKSTRLESVGTLAGGIAHDFNNILTGILGNVQLAKDYLETNKTDDASEMLAEAEKASLRARDLTRQLLTFSRGGAPVKKVIHVNDLIKESATFALRGSNVKPEFAIQDDLWAAEADEGQINQVISNLVINADQSMPNGGIINIKVGNVVIGIKQQLPLPEGNYIEIVVEDHGTGIPKDHQNKIFDPYFTTKQKGSGLGLATVYSIIKNHGGHITFESELGVGTAFHIYLPATKEKIIKRKKNEETTTKLLSSTHSRILIMDDEEVILMLLNRMLKGAGYEVELTRDGAETIKRYTEAKKSGQTFDAVILDLTVPGGIGGKDVIAKLLEIDPGVKAIVSSGYATDPIMSDFKKYGFSGVVAKPYNLEQMQETLHDVLAEK